MSKAVTQRQVDAEMIAATANIVSAGYEVRSVGSGRDGVRRWAVHRPDPKTGSRYNERSYFDRDGIVAVGLAGSKQGIRDAIAAAPKPTNHYIDIREDENDMATKKEAKKKAAKKTTAASERAARATKAAATKGKAEAKPKAATKGKATEQPERPRAARATKAEGESKRPSGADVAGATPEMLAMLASYQEQTIERMNGARVVETYIHLSGSTLDNPVTHKSLKPYPARIARELKRLGLFTTESVPGVGLVYLPVQQAQA